MENVLEKTTIEDEGGRLLQLERKRGGEFERELG